MSKINKEVLIAPSILAADFANLAKEVQAVEKAGANWIQVDVMDGQFVHNLSFGPDTVRWLKKYSHLFMDVHLMVQNPQPLLESFATAGADLLTVHLEVCKSPKQIIRQIHSLGTKAGFAIKPDTPLKKLLPYVGQIDLALLMSVHPGWAGQKFIHSVLSKFRELRRYAHQEKIPLWIEADGGINFETAPLAVGAGANVVVVGSAIFHSPEGSAQALKRLRRVIDTVIAERV